MLFEGILCEISPVTIVVVAVVLVNILIFKLIIWKYGKLWLQSTLSGVPIPFAEIIGMVLRKTNPEVILINRIVASKAGLDLSTAQLEAHTIVGGNVNNVVHAMIVLNRAGLNPGWDTLAKEDLQGRDVLEEARLSAQRILNDEDDFENEYVGNNEKVN